MLGLVYEPWWCSAGEARTAGVRAARTRPTKVAVCMLIIEVVETRDLSSVEELLIVADRQRLVCHGLNLCSGESDEFENENGGFWSGFGAFYRNLSEYQPDRRASHKQCVIDGLRTYSFVTMVLRNVIVGT